MSSKEAVQRLKEIIRKDREATRQEVPVEKKTA